MQKKKYGNKLKTVNYRNLVKKLFAQETNISNCLNNLKVFAHYGIIVKNQLSKLEKKI